ncbi:MAG: pro-sigmaK processing inhibitor BofA family protein [Lachnospiraceae bacterium]|nr:pro-sigmaK processing inhibitor BofA family protein [Lachnospiraceae bacterium]
MTSINLPILIITVASVLLVLLIGRKRPDYAVNFFLRIGLCYVAIYFINDALLDKGIEMCVAMNAVTFLVCGFLGFPGLFLLYGLVVWGYFIGM